MKEKNGFPTYVRLDCGGENMAMRKFYNDHGIKVKLTPPYQRKFAVITSMAMALLWNAGYTSSMKKKLLPQALITASFLNDIVPTAKSKIKCKGVMGW